MDIKHWYTKLSILERQVCLVKRKDGRGLGTGFLVGPDIILTAAHVVFPELARRTDAQVDVSFRPDILFIFDYVLSLDGDIVDEGNVTYPLSDSEWMVDFLPVGNPQDETFYDATSPKLDFALLRTHGEPGNEPLNDGDVIPRGWIEF